MSDAKFTWNVFYRGKEGFKEHIQATAEDGSALAGARKSVLDTLSQIGATPEVDAPRGRGSYSSGPQRPAGADAMAKAAVAAGVVSEVCPVHNSALVYKEGGLSKTKTLPDGSPKPFSPSYRCPERNCTTIKWVS